MEGAVEFRTFVSRISIAFSTVLCVTVLFLGPSAQSRLHAQDETGGISPTIALLETRVTWARGFPFFPANEARYYEGRYDTPAGPVEVFLVEPSIPGVPPFESGTPPAIPCTQADLAVFGTIVEAASPVPTYRVFFRASTGESKVQRAPNAPPAPTTPTTTSSSTAPPGESADLCAFAAAFIDAFEFFRVAAADRGRPLSFSGGMKPEFPAVVEVAR